MSTEWWLSTWFELVERKLATVSVFVSGVANIVPHINNFVALQDSQRHGWISDFSKGSYGSSLNHSMLKGTSKQTDNRPPPTTDHRYQVSVCVNVSTFYFPFQTKIYHWRNGHYQGMPLYRLWHDKWQVISLFRELVDNLHQRNVNVFLISGGFRCIVEHVASQLSIPLHHVYANRLKFYFNGESPGPPFQLRETLVGVLNTLVHPILLDGKTLSFLYCMSTLKANSANVFVELIFKWNAYTHFKL